MFPNFQATVACLTALLLLVQTVCPGVAFGCDCQSIVSSSSTADQECCCSSEKKNLAKTKRCIHCQALTECVDENESASTSGEFPSRLVCHCGDFLPVAPVQQGIPGSSESTVAHLLNLIVSFETHVPTQVVSVPTWVPFPEPSNEVLTLHHKQIVLCVWQT